MMCSEKWEIAQMHEQLFWSKVAESIRKGSKGQLYWYNWKARRITDMLWEKCAFAMQDNHSILEIGSGPVGIVSKLHAGKRYAVDPLEDFYKADAELIKLRDPDVNFFQGRGEDLPFESELFDLLILDNILDHAQDPNSILAEAHRVLKPGGIVYAALNTRTYIGNFIHNLVSRIGIDKKHPHSFTAKSISSTIGCFRFRKVHEEFESFYKIAFADLRSRNLKNYIKTASLMSEIYYENISLRS